MDHWIHNSCRILFSNNFGVWISQTDPIIIVITTIRIRMTIMECICKLLGSLFMSHQIGYIIGIQTKGVIRFLIHLEILPYSRFSAFYGVAIPPPSWSIEISSFPRIMLPGDSMPNWVRSIVLFYVGLNPSLMRRKMEFEAELQSFRNVHSRFCTIISRYKWMYFPSHIQMKSANQLLQSPIVVMGMHFTLLII